jgi:hypothetical protein
MFVLNFATVFLFGVDGHIKFTECQAEYYRTLPGNEDVVFDTDGRPCPKKRKRRGLISNNIEWLARNMRWKNVLKDGNLQ